MKNSKDKQKEIVARVQSVILKINEISKDVEVLRSNSSDFFLFENTWIKLECVQKELNFEERELKKLSYKIADYVNVNIHTKFSELLQNIFILKKSYSSSKKQVHYFEWGSKFIHFYDVQKCT